MLHQFGLHCTLTGTLQSEVSLERRYEQNVAGIVVCVQLNALQELCFFYSDGAVEFRDTRLMDIIRSDWDGNRAPSMRHVGFAFPKTEECMFRFKRNGVAAKSGEKVSLMSRYHHPPA